MQTTEGMVWAVIVFAIVSLIYVAAFPFLHKGNGGNIGGDWDD